MVDGPGVENGQMDGKAVWSRRERWGGVLDGRGRLSDYDSGRDDLRQKIEVGRAPNSSTASG